MKLAIQQSDNSYSIRWINYCKEKNIPYKLVDCYANDIIQQLDDCDALLWHHNHASSKDILFAQQLLFSLQQAGKKVFPDFNTAWHFDDKVGQKYLMEALKIDAVNTYVFYSKKEALDWVSATTFPKVFKLRGGAGSANVKLAKDKTSAARFVIRAFGQGFSQYNAVDNLKERFRKFKHGSATAKDLGKGIARFIVPPLSSKIAGKEIGYVYFQDFIPNNDHDIRVVVIGDKAFAIKRMTRENDFRASGSGNILYNKNLFDEEVIKASFAINEKIRSQCLALDFVFDNGKPLVVEISYGVSMAGYDDCPGYWDKQMNWHEGKFNPQTWMVDNIIQQIQQQQGT
jgi:glutathione synthase/RimK-type ligase-like ATP-grasp enzyme